MKTIFNLTGPHFEKDSDVVPVTPPYLFKLYINKKLCASSNDSGKLLAYVYFMNLENNCTNFELYINSNTLYSCTYYLKDHYERFKEKLLPIWKSTVQINEQFSMSLFSNDNK